MYLFKNILLSLNFIFLFLSFLLLTTIKFQILDFNFWTSSYNKNFYEILAIDLKSKITTAFEKEGASLEQISQFTNFVTPESLEDLTTKNLKNILDYANGQRKDLYVYLPADKFPQGMIPQNYITSSNEIAIKTILSDTRQLDPNVYKILDSSSNLGAAVFVLWLIHLIFLILNIVGFYKNTNEGKRLINIGVSFLISGLLIIFSIRAIEIVKTNWIRSLTPENEIYGMLSSPLISPITNLWFIVSITLCVVGIAMFFIKKRMKKAVIEQPVLSVLPTLPQNQ